MKKTTDLDGVKSIAISFLYMEPIPVEGIMSDFFVSHPMIESVYLPNKNMELFNLFEDKESFAEYRIRMKKNIESADDIWKISMLIRKPYKLAFFKYINEYLSAVDFAETLIEYYTDTEFTSDTTNVSKKELVRWFEKANKPLLMEENDMNVYLELPETVTIYRGVQDKKYKKEMSWTLSLEKARWFANRFSRNSESAIYKATVNKQDILCYTNRRGEQEIIINPVKLNAIVEAY